MSATRTGRAPGGMAAIRLRIDAAPGLSSQEAEALAGLIEADGSLQISPNNNGTTWTCSMSIALREDDGALLSDIQADTGLGHLCYTRATAVSRPQVLWRLSSKLECREFAGLLRRHPFRGRKAIQASIWIKAVDVWAGSSRGDPVASAALERFYGELRTTRDYVVDREPAPSTPPETRESLLAYFGGFVTGEGSFALSERAARFVVHLRRDDRPLLELFARTFEIGSINDGRAYGTSAPTSSWVVCAKRDLACSIELLDSAGLRGRKLRQYLAWRPGVSEVVRAGQTDECPDPDAMATAKQALADATNYRPVQWTPPTASAKQEDALEAYRRVLRRWAGEEPGPLSCVAYEKARARHPTWPKRDTLAANFGSWRGAIEAAGLGARVARSARWP